MSQPVAFEECSSIGAMGYASRDESCVGIISGPLRISLRAAVRGGMPSPDRARSLKGLNAGRQRDDRVLRTRKFYDCSFAGHAERLLASKAKNFFDWKREDEARATMNR
jgi:hypothetical protein